MPRKRRIVYRWSFEPDRYAVVLAGLRASVEPSILPRAPENLFPSLAERLLTRAASFPNFRIQMTTGADGCASASDFIRDRGRLVVSLRQREPLEHSGLERSAFGLFGADTVIVPTQAGVSRTSLVNNFLRGVSERQSSAFPIISDTRNNS